MEAMKTEAMKITPAVIPVLALDKALLLRASDYLICLVSMSSLLTFTDSLPEMN